MGNTGTFKVDLVDVYRQQPTDSGATVRFNGNGMRESTVRDCKLPNSFAGLPAFPQANNLMCRIWPARYRSTHSGFFTLQDGQTVAETLNVWMKPTEWNAKFDKWGDLPHRFQSMKKKLNESPKLRVKGGPVFEKFVEATYDDADQSIDLAKAGLINVFVKMSKITAPTPGGKRWFTYIKSILEISRDRFIAVVEDEMGQAVKTIKKNITRFKEYENTAAQNHHGNLPSNYNARKKDMFSVKTSEDLGNLQLTLAPATDPDGKSVLLLDADIDENGRLLQHTLDVLFRHRFNGGTHPYDIHQILVVQDREDAFGYRLV